MDAELDSKARHFDIHATTPREAHALFGDARAECPVMHSEQMGGFHAMIGYSTVRDTLLAKDTFGSGPAIARPLLDRPPFPAVEHDGEEHQFWRKLMMLGVNPETAHRIEPAVRADIDRILDDLDGRESCDLVADFADLIPALAICHALGLDREHGPRIRTYTKRLVETMGDPVEGAKAFQEFAEFGVAEVMKRRSEPRDDFLTILATTKIDSEPLTADIIAGAIVGLTSAGNDSTASGLSSLLYEVLSRPHVRAAIVADPSLADAAVEEALRLRPPFFGFWRRATRTAEVAGVEIPEGGDVFVCWTAGNRDPDTFDDPDNMRLDLKRKRHMSFGWGPHACPGAGMARLEMRVALCALLERFPNVQLLDDSDDAYTLFGGMGLGFASLPARL